MGDVTRRFDCSPPTVTAVTQSCRPGPHSGSGLVALARPAARSGTGPAARSGSGPAAPSRAPGQVLPPRPALRNRSCRPGPRSGSGPAAPPRAPGQVLPPRPAPVRAPGQVLPGAPGQVLLPRSALRVRSCRALRVSPAVPRRHGRAATSGSGCLSASWRWRGDRGGDCGKHHMTVAARPGGVPCTLHCASARLQCPPRS